MKKEMDRETLVNLARTALRTKLSARVADILTEVGSTYCRDEVKMRIII